MKKRISMLLCVLFVLSAFAGCAPAPASAEPTPAAQTAPEPAAPAYTPGTYTAEVVAMHGPLSVEVTLSETAITDVNVTSHVETPGVSDPAIKLIPERIVAQQSLAVDAVTGATITSASIVNAVKKSLESANVDIAPLQVKAETPPASDIEQSADVVIVGGGGAGLAAAVAATNEGASVILIEKSGFLGGNSIVAGGIYNAPDPSLQDHAEVSGDLDALVEAAINEKPVNDEHAALIAAVKEEYEAYKKTDKTLFDSPNWFALQTWNGGDKLGVLSMVELFTGKALDGLKWLESMGMEFKQAIHHGGGSLYPRTHSAIMPNGTGYIKAFTDKLDGNPNFNLMMETTGKSLIMDGDAIVGVNAVGKDGNAVTLKATKGVILATGGFAGNVELRQRFCEGEKWPDLGPNVPTSNMPAVTGDGIFMAEDAGAALMNMDQIQLLPYCNPQTGATYDIVQGTGSAVFINKEGQRFVREDGRRDEMSKAIIAQTDGVMYMLQSADGIPDPETALALGGTSLAYMLENNLSGYVAADTLEELAAKLGMPADALVQTVAEYNGYVDTQKADPFGRVSYGSKLETGPFYAYPRKPAVHHTMGGVVVDENARALREDGSVIQGLFCAGEIMGVLHGGNRLGGNAIVDFVVFGRIAGEAAAKGA